MPSSWRLERLDHAAAVRLHRLAQRGAEAGGYSEGEAAEIERAVERHSG
jgi:hypothetical protein